VRLLIAEKPSMARSIASALRVAGTGQGCIAGREMIVTWCIGHLVELAPPEAYEPSLERWTLEALPILPTAFRLAASDRTKAQFRVVRDLLGRGDVTDVVNACDSGREGELIFDYVYRLAACRKPVLRFWTASLTDEAIRTAYDQLKPASAYAGLRDAARSRSEADWLVGLNATRAQTLVAQRAGHRGVWSLGRVQTPTLALVVERDRQIRDFVAKDFWLVDATLAAPSGTFKARWFRGRGEDLVERFERADEARAVAAAARRAPARVLEVDAKDVRVPPERLYDLTTLQRESNRRWGYSAQKTLDVAQVLYEQHKVLSYPRTSSRHLTTDVAATLPALLDAVARLPPYAQLARQAIDTRATLGSRFVDNAKVEDHHALLPTGRAPASLDEAEARVFDLVVRRFLAAFLPDRVEARTSVTCDVGGERFRARGLVVKAAGWAAVDPPTMEKPAKGEDDAAPSLPALRASEPLGVEDVKVLARNTKPPRPFTDAELLGAMETAGKTLEDEELRLAMRESGLGTPATRAAVIEHLLAREYLVRVRKNLEATPRGAALIDALPAAALKSAQLTGTWEARLARMARGEYARDTFMLELAAYTREVVEQLLQAPPPRAVPDTARATRPAAKPPRLATAAPPGAASPDHNRPAPPRGETCNGCGNAARVVWSQRQQAWLFRCDPCNVWGRPNA